MGALGSLEGSVDPLHLHVEVRAQHFLHIGNTFVRTSQVFFEAHGPYGHILDPLGLCVDVVVHGWNIGVVAGDRHDEGRQVWQKLRQPQDGVAPTRGADEVDALRVQWKVSADGGKQDLYSPRHPRRAKPCWHCSGMRTPQCRCAGDRTPMAWRHPLWRSLHVVHPVRHCAAMHCTVLHCSCAALYMCCNASVLHCICATRISTAPLLHSCCSNAFQTADSLIHCCNVRTYARLPQFPQCMLH